MDSLPVPRSVLRVDIVRSSSRGPDRQTFLDAQLKSVVERASESGLHLLFPNAAMHTRPDGDSMTLLIGPEVPKAWLLADFVLRELAIALHDVNRRADPEHRLQVRAALDHGEITVNAPHLGGPAVVTTARLVDAGPLREFVERHPARDLALIISDRYYQDVVTSGVRGLDRLVFDRVEVEVKDFRQVGWLFQPDVSPERRVA
ncbi:hypothetical protein [Saccharothrix sp. NRRL B-16348]|uniref:hypothetical protein n=1 Tax=Saccharothrix sp. NRRL B-16348 TaxID=1415542 RepID=UPI000AF1AC4D|nr:hypothetical protein [Saccharothrix sp. NRRL B-16348]